MKTILILHVSKIASRLAQAAGMLALLLLAGCGSKLAVETSIDLRQDGGDPARHDPESFTAQSGQDVRFRLTPRNDGYLYVILKGSSGFCALLFPVGDRPGAQVRAGEVIVLPGSKENWLRFDTTPGPEHLYVVLSQSKVPALEALAGGSDPATETILKAVDEVQAKIGTSIVKRSTGDSTVYSRSVRGSDGTMLADIEIKHF